jgi:hypothetical protein
MTTCRTRSSRRAAHVWAKCRCSDDELDKLLLHEGLQASVPANIIILDD